jgi:hypothetical protein
MGGKYTLERHGLQLPHLDAAVAADTIVTTHMLSVSGQILHDRQVENMSKHAPATDASDTRRRNVHCQHWRVAVPLRGHLHAVARVIYTHHLVNRGRTHVNAIKTWGGSNNARHPRRRP